VRRFAALAVLVAALLARGEAGSPLAMCAALEARMAAGDGATLPDANAELVRHAGTVDVARGEWPEAFAARAGETVCVAVSPYTGCYEFFDESGQCFYTLVPILATTENWVAPFRHAEEGPFPDDDLYAPWRLVDVWSLSHAESAEFFDLDFGFVNNGGQLRFVNNPTNLCFTSFAFSETNLCFTAAWPTNEALPQSVLDLYGSTNLSSRWTLLSSHPATTNPVSFAVVRATLPWYVEPTQHVHDASCVSLTNVVLSPLDGVTVYTNAFWSCSTNRTPGEAGFFRLGTRHDTDGDGFYDAAEILVHGTRPDRLDSDGDGVPDGVVPSVWWSNPIWATNYLDADFSVDIVAPTDGSAETVFSIDGLRIPLSPAAGPWYFSLPAGQVVSCSASTTGPFYLLWAGTSGGSFWNEPDTFESPFWTSGNLAGYHEGSSSCQIAVPVLAVEPDFGGGLRSGGPANGSHIGQDGSVCVHAADGIQRYTWSVAPAVVAAGRTPTATGAVQIESGNPFIDVSAASNVLSGSFGFGPGSTAGGGTLWGSLTNALAAHRCDATLSFPYCSVCGDSETFDETMFDIALVVSKSLLTLKHDNQATISISRSGPWGDSPPEGTVEIRRSGAANEWLTLGVESDLDPWTARIAGHFDLRGIVSCGAFALTTAVQQVEVQFPSGIQIANDDDFVSSAEWAWDLMVSEAAEPPHFQREYGFCVFLVTSNSVYDCSDIQQGLLIPPWGDGEIAIDCDPATEPENPSPTAAGARYAVATFHTHPTAAYAFEGWSRPAGPSNDDVTNAVTRGMPSIVADYVPLEGNNGTILGGHALDAEHQRTLISEPTRRNTP
jgi:hypothetical protein